MVMYHHYDLQENIAVFCYGNAYATNHPNIFENDTFTKAATFPVLPHERIWA